MNTVSKIREGLSQIPGALLDFPPEEAYQGSEPGVQVQTLSGGIESPELNNPESMSAFWEDDDLTDDDSGAHGVPDFDPLIEIGPEIEDTIAALGGVAGERIRKSMEVHGMDALGWYSTFHVTGVQWGIYLPISGIAYLMREAFHGLNVSWETKAHLAFHAILNHELFHFATDYAMAQAELALEEPWWAPAKIAFRAGSPNYCAQEEKLANAYMLKAFRTMKPALRVRGKQQALRDFTLLQPAGYCDGIQVAREGWGANLTRLAQRYTEHSTKGQIHPHLSISGAWDWPMMFPIQPKIDCRYCPIHLIHDGARLGIPGNFLTFFNRLEHVEESEQFLKKLRKLSPHMQDAWNRTKLLLQEKLTTGADFKRWSKSDRDVWSVRINKGFRAHLRKESGGVWQALDIGNHKEMGHG